MIQVFSDSDNQKYIPLWPLQDMLGNKKLFFFAFTILAIIYCGNNNL
jgi:hypothetical protein